MSDYIVILLGILAGLFLFYRFPILKEKEERRESLPSDLKISVVIPCRNEEKNIEKLLDCLLGQTYTPHEIICVDDQSEDKTADVIREKGARLLQLFSRDEGWIGKPFAVQKGAEAATGNVLLFLDADLDLLPNALETLAAKYIEIGALSVQPYHAMKKPYEQLALFFNLAAVANTGIALPVPRTKGMFGPLIMINKDKYFELGGHTSVKDCVVEDYALGMHYKKMGFPYTLFIGDQNIAFRMYPSGLKGQFEGFTKNISKGILSSGILTAVLTFLFITACAAIPFQWIRGVILENVPLIIFNSSLYAAVSVMIGVYGKKLGNFSFFGAFLYPVHLVWFMVVILYSFIRKFIFKKVKWKGRNIKI